MRLPADKLEALRFKLQQQQRKNLLTNGLGVSRAIHLKDEAKKLHLTNQKGQLRGFIELRCAKCKRPHKDNPAASEYFKVLLDKDMLKCFCGSRNFVRTARTKTQGELISDIISDKSRHIRKHIEDYTD